MRPSLFGPRRSRLTAAAQLILLLLVLQLLLLSQILAADPQLNLVHVLLLLYVLDRWETEFFRLELLLGWWYPFLRGRAPLELWDNLHIRDILP